MLMIKSLRQKIIEKLCEKFQPKAEVNDNLAHYINQELDKIESIKNSIEACDKDILAKKEQFESDIKVINTSKSLIMRSCEHLVATYHGDPSGNNDSCIICDICGKEL